MNWGWWEVKQYSYIPCPRCGTTTYTNTCNCKPYLVRFVGNGLLTPAVEVHAYSPGHAVERGCKRWDADNPTSPIETFGGVVGYVSQGRTVEQRYAVTVVRRSNHQFYAADRYIEKRPQQLTLI